MSTLSYASEQKAKTGLRPSRQAIKRAALALAAALGVAAATDFGHYYLTTGRYLETTDDAYVKADSTIIAPKVSGYIAQELVNDNQPVTAGQLLAKIDDRDFRAVHAFTLTCYSYAINATHVTHPSAVAKHAGFAAASYAVLAALLFLVQPCLTRRLATRTVPDWQAAIVEDLAAAVVAGWAASRTSAAGQEIR